MAIIPASGGTSATSGMSPASAGLMGAGLEFTGTALSDLLGYASTQQQENYQTWASDTAWQRGVAGMKAAGINPLYAAGATPASTPSGTSFTPANPASGAANSALQVALANTQLANLQKQGALLDSQKNKTDTDQIGSDHANVSSSLDLMYKLINGYDQNVAMLDNVRANTFATNTHALKEGGVDTTLTAAQIPKVLADTANVNANAAGTVADNVRKIATSQVYKAAPIMGWLDPFLDVIKKAASIYIP